MAGRLAGKRIAILATDGVEQVELTDEGARAEIVSPAKRKIQAMNSDIEPADQFSVDVTAADASAGEYDALRRNSGDQARSGGMGR